MLRQCKPKNVSELNFYIFLICKRFAKQGKNSSDLFSTMFSTIDTSHNGEISKSEFVIGLRNNLKLWIPEENLLKVFEELDCGNEIDMNEFKTILANFTNNYNSHAKDDDYIVTKSQFLNACVDICSAIERRDLAFAMQYFVKNAHSNAIHPD